MFVIGIIFESTGLVFLKKGMMTVPEVRPLTVSKVFSVVKTAATNGQILLGVFCQAVFFACLLVLMTQADISFLWFCGRYGRWGYFSTRARFFSSLGRSNTKHDWCGADWLQRACEVDS
jgi:hypothetical protein